MVQQVSLTGFDNVSGLPSPAFSQETGHAAVAMRINEYLRAGGLPDALAEQWSAQLLAEHPDLDLSNAARFAQRGLDAWLTQQLGNPLGLRTDAARAWLPYWNIGQSPCCLPATPAPAELEMPTQMLHLRSLRGMIKTACRECLPLSQRFYRWLRGL